MWVNVHRSQGGEEYEQVSFTLARSYRTEDGWLLEGYTDSMMVYLEELVMDVIRLRCNATASITERDQRIAAAFGRDID